MKITQITLPSHRLLHQSLEAENHCTGAPVRLLWINPQLTGCTSLLASCRLRCAMTALRAA